MRVRRQTSSESSSRNQDDEFSGIHATRSSTESALVPEYLGPDHVDKARRDALTVPWGAFAGDGAVWLNPPYSVPLIRDFLAKAVETALAGTKVIGLVPASTDTRWWHDFVTVPRAQAEFIVGRLRFGGPHSTGGPATFGSALITWSAG